MTNYYTFYFKLAFTCQTKYYYVNTNISVNKFINNMKNRIINDFDIGNEYDIEIVEVGNPNNINGRLAELAPAIEPSELTLREIYGKNMSFYIRKIPNDIIIQL
jgi:hypothetical protein